MVSSTLKNNLLPKITPSEIKAIITNEIILRFFLMNPLPKSPAKIAKATIRPTPPEREFVKIKATKMVKVTRLAKIFVFRSFAIKVRASAIGRVKTKYDASQLGWPSVEKIRSFGLNSACQQLEVSLPTKTTQDGSLPKWEGMPQRETVKAAMTMAINNFLICSPFRLISAQAKIKK